MTAWTGPEETTIEAVHAAYRSGELSARELVETYLSRIEQIDRDGPHLNAIVNLNPDAVPVAEELDRQFEATGEFVGPLHGIPIAVKDQVMTAQMPTTFGSIANEGYQPTRDGTAITKLRDAGAIILAKTTLPDFATSWFAYSSASGTTKNPYDLDRDPGGSSSGTAAAVASNLATVGIGEDTGGSNRLPASFCNLVGLRVTTGLISRDGASPLVGFQDTLCPMTRTVADTARLLDVLVGYDPKDPLTAVNVLRSSERSYQEQLSEHPLEGARIGVLREVFGADDDPDSGTVNEVVQAALNEFQAAGATLIDPIEIPDLVDLIMLTSLYLTHSKHDIDAFLAANPDVPSRSIDALAAADQYHPRLDLFEEIIASSPDPHDDPIYHERMAARERFQLTVLNVMAGHELDLIVFPTTQLLPPTRETLDAGTWTVLTFPTNTLIAAQTGMPALSMPVGFSPGGVPVGLEMVGKPHGEARLLGLAHSYEQAAPHRRAPTL
jgi:amidase